MAPASGHVGAPQTGYQAFSHFHIRFPSETGRDVSVFRQWCQRFYRLSSPARPEAGKVAAGKWGLAIDCWIRVFTRLEVRHFLCLSVSKRPTVFRAFAVLDYFRTSFAVMAPRIPGGR